MDKAESVSGPDKTPLEDQVKQTIPIEFKCIYTSGKKKQCIFKIAV